MAYLANAYAGYEKKEYSPREDTFAVLSPEQKKLGRVKEITSSGLTYDYIDESQNPARFEQVENPIQKIDIFIKKQGYFLKDIPLKKLTDRVVISTPTFCQLPMRQIQVEFGPLDDTQLRKLDYLMNCFEIYAFI